MVYEEDLLCSKPHPIVKIEAKMLTVIINIALFDEYKFNDFITSILCHNYPWDRVVSIQKSN